MIGEESFITAIITQAVEDTMYMGKRPRYLKHKADAIDWILNEESEDHWAFINYCAILGVDPARIKRKVKGFIDPKLTETQKLIIKANMKKGRQDDNTIQV
jgi:hypothetical protein|tara:strand:- start:1100 stop:1402 length:303 start_codon:yes stop_codon:yes gene_type:complete